MAVNKYTEARRRANEKYNAKTYEEIKVRVHKGQKEVIKAHADKQDESVSGYIKKSIRTRMENEDKNG